MKLTEFMKPKRADVLSIGNGLRGGMLYKYHWLFLKGTEQSGWKAMFCPDDIPFTKGPIDVQLDDNGKVVIKKTAGDDVSRFCKVHTHRQKRK